MSRLRSLVICVLTSALLPVQVPADDQPKKLTDEERKDLEAQRLKWNRTGLEAFQKRQFPAAQKALETTLEITRKLYPKAEFPDGHADLVTSLNNLAFLSLARGNWTTAEPLFKDALEMRKRLFKGDHPDVANSLNDLARLYNAQRKYEAAEPLLKDALEMRKRLFKGDHPDVVNSLNDLAILHHTQRRYEAAEPLFKDALEMNKRLFPGDTPNVANGLSNLALLHRDQGKNATAERLLKDALNMRKRLSPGDHAGVADNLNNLAGVYQAQAKYASAEPLFKDALKMRKRLFKGDHPSVAESLNNLAGLYQVQGKYATAEPLFKDALEIRKRLFKGDHPKIANSLNNLAGLYLAQAKYASAEPLFKDALAMHKRLFPSDNPNVADSLTNLALVYRDLGKYVAAEPLYETALAMYKRLFPGDHPSVANCLNNLALLHQIQGRYAAAEPLYETALAMYKRLFPGDHPSVANCLNNLGGLYRDQAKYGTAETLFTDALEMHKRLFPGDHPGAAHGLNNLGGLYRDQAKYGTAEPLFTDALAMYKRLFPGDHPGLINCLNNLALLHQARGKYASAETLHNDVLARSQRLVVAFAKRKAEGEALTFAASLPLYRDCFLSLAAQRKQVLSSPNGAAATYSVLWTTKGLLARVYEQRQLQTRAAAVDPALAQTFARLADARRHRAEIFLAPATTDDDTLKQRATELSTFDAQIVELTRTLTEQFPPTARAEKLTAATLTDLQTALPADAAVADFYHYTHFEWDHTRPDGEKEKRTNRYVAFVVTRDRVTWVDLGAAAPIGEAVRVWREGVVGHKEIPPAVPNRVRELIWDPVRKHLPGPVRTVYLCPDADLCAVPFAALPGDKPGTIVLEDFALATVPHAPFLLDKLWPQDPIPNPRAGALVVGGVKYDADVAPNAIASRNGDPLLRPVQKIAWAFLPGSAAEANGLAATAARKKLVATRLDGDKATPAAVLAALPRAKHAHLATHGFFADPAFRSVLQLNEKDFEVSRQGERIGKAVNSPLVMSGLVFAGANRPNTPGRGIVTGEQLIDLDLSGLELAVLSACETGLGAVAGGEGVYGLQRAFHYAGTTNVVASLWKVPDESTAALMALFYRNLWELNRTPLESLRQAQLEIYRHPDKIPELAKGFRGEFEIVTGSPTAVEIKPNTDGKTHPLFWAAFTLSGPGR